MFQPYTQLPAPPSLPSLHSQPEGLAGIGVVAECIADDVLLYIASGLHHAQDLLTVPDDLANLRARGGD